MLNDDILNHIRLLILDPHQFYLRWRAEFLNIEFGFFALTVMLTIKDSEFDIADIMLSVL